MLSKHKEVFSEGLGLLKGIKASLTVDPDATPTFLKARPEPYALKQNIKAGLDDLEKQGNIKPAATSRWAAPIVPIANSNRVRICGDFKVTLNPVLADDKNPLPRIEDIFANLAGGCVFTKIDLASAYLQMKVEDDSREFLIVNTNYGLYQ